MRDSPSKSTADKIMGKEHNRCKCSVTPRCIVKSIILVGSKLGRFLKQNIGSRGYDFKAYEV
jgi:hypothetical protein